MTTTSTAADNFIARWRNRDGTEKSNFQLFLGELCELLGVGKPDPAHADRPCHRFHRQTQLAERLPEQIRIVRELLQLAPQTAETLADRFKRKPIKGVQPVVDALVGLGMVASEDGVYHAGSV